MLSTILVWVLSVRAFYALANTQTQPKSNNFEPTY